MGLSKDVQGKHRLPWLPLDLLIGFSAWIPVKELPWIIQGRFHNGFGRCLCCFAGRDLRTHQPWQKKISDVNLGNWTQHKLNGFSTVFPAFLKTGVPGISNGLPWFSMIVFGIAEGSWHSWEFSQYFICNPNWIHLIMRAKTRRHLIEHCAPQISKGCLFNGYPWCISVFVRKIWANDWMITMTNPAEPYLTTPFLDL